MKKSICLLLALVIVASAFAYTAFPASASGLLSAAELESRLGTVIAEMNIYGDSCYFSSNNPLSIDHWVWEENCSWDTSHAYEHNEYPPGSGHCAILIGQCTWYAYGRFLEVYGIALSGHIPNAIDWPNEIPANNKSKGVIYSSKSEVSSPVVGSVFVKKSSSIYGHVGFVEGISADGQYVYYTDANYNGIPGAKPNLFDLTDGQVRKKTVEDFNSTVIGYIYTDKTVLPPAYEAQTVVMHSVAASATGQSSVNVRTEPGGEIIGSLYYGQTVNAYSDSVTTYNGLDWIKVKYSGTTGYVALNYLLDGTAKPMAGVGRLLSERELIDSIDYIPANLDSENFTANNPFAVNTREWYAYGRFAEVSEINLKDVPSSVSEWASVIPKNNTASGIVFQAGGDPVPGSLYISDAGSVGIIEGVSSAGDVYFTTALRDYKLKMMSISAFTDGIKGYLYSNYVHIEGIQIDKSTVSLKTGESETVVASVLPSNASQKELLWSSENPTIATVSNGKITAVAPGETNIIVTAATGISKTIFVDVISSTVFASDILLSTQSLTLELGTADLITATLVPENTTNQSVSFISSSPSVATVLPNGIVYSGKCGNTTICVLSGDGVVMKEISVTVVYPEKLWSEWLESFPPLEPETEKDGAIFYSYKLPDGTTSAFVPYKANGNIVAQKSFYRYVMPFIPGDVDFNRTVDLSDAMKVFMYIAGKIINIDEQVADMNNDGKLGLNDAMLLFLIVSGKKS